MQHEVPLTDGRGHQIGSAKVNDETFAVEATVTEPYWMEMIYGDNDLEFFYNTVWTKNPDGSKCFREAFPVPQPVLSRVKLTDADLPPAP